jgi:surfeit locus 1 family protein
MTPTSAPSARPATTWHRLLIPSVTTLVMLALLIGLGNWQVRRLAWKQGILADIDRAEASPAIPLPPNPSPYQKVRIEGVWRPGPSALFGDDVRDTPDGPKMGGDLITPLQPPTGEAILVDRGWIPQTGPTDPSPTKGLVIIEGFIRVPEKPGLFSAADNPTARLFYTLDPAAMGAALGLPDIRPFTLIAMGHVAPGVLPIPAESLPRPPNNHLVYAITWYSLAATLVIIFGIWSVRRLPSR